MEDSTNRLSRRINGLVTSGKYFRNSTKYEIKTLKCLCVCLFINQIMTLILIFSR